MSAKSGAQELLTLLADPFSSQLASDSIYYAFIYAFVGAFACFASFSILRPRRPGVYAPRSKHADEAHKPPILKKGFFSWRRAIKDVKEDQLLLKIGMDAVIFLRFLSMCRNIFLVLTVIGCAILIPTALAPGTNIYAVYGDVAILMRFTPQYIFGARFWAYVGCAYAFDLVICFFLYWNYGAVTRLRRKYFQTEEYQQSLHSRTLMVNHVPKLLHSNDGLELIISEVNKTDATPSASIGRDITELSILMDQHDDAVEALEAQLATYLHNPDKLPSKRPRIKPFKSDKTHNHNQKVDAINYLYARVQLLKSHIEQIREDISIGKQNPMPYGFASFTEIEDAHLVAYAARGKKIRGAHVALAPKPTDLIWQNIGMSRADKRGKRIWFTFLNSLLTLVYIPVNVFTAVFLSNLSHLGLLWPWFQGQLEAHPKGWSAAQGILAPLLTTLFYFVLPSFFRRSYEHSGDKTRTARERHVTNSLFTFAVVNKLIVFSLFSSIFSYVVAVVASSRTQSVLESLKSADFLPTLFLGLCGVSPYWMTFQSQSTFFAAYDLLQMVSLLGHPVMRAWMSPTPRQIIKFDSPGSMLYAEYYSGYLFAVMVGLCFATLQPLILPITGLFLAVEYWFKKYMVQYVYVTKYESGGLFWKNLFNRVLLSAFFGNLIVALVVAASTDDYNMLYAMIPLPFLLLGFKWYCSQKYHKQIYFYSGLVGDGEGRNLGTLKATKASKTTLDRRFGHPALTKKLLIPMVNEKVKHMLGEVIQGHVAQDIPTEDDSYLDRQAVQYTDVSMSSMAGSHLPGKLASSTSNPSDDFELVAENDMEFRKFKRRADFSEEAGEGGELYGKPGDLISRSGTPAPERDGYPASIRSQTHSPSPSRGTSYHAGYHHASFRDASPAARPIGVLPPRINVTLPAGDHDDGDLGDETRGRLLRYSAPMGERDQSVGIAVTPGTGRGTPVSFDEEEETSYDYFRHGRGGNGMR